MIFFGSLKLVIDVFSLSQVAYLAASFKVIYVLARPAVSIKGEKLNSCNHSLITLINLCAHSYCHTDLCNCLQSFKLKQSGWQSCSFYCHISYTFCFWFPENKCLIIVSIFWFLVLYKCFQNFVDFGNNKTEVSFGSHVIFSF